MRLTGDDWARALHDFTETAFRWEAQPAYDEPYEHEPMATFLRGDTPDLSYMTSWLTRIRADTAVGKTYRRVRMVTDPLTDYLRFELGVTDRNIAAGEQIRVLTEAQVVELRLPRQDFWLFDDDRAAVMRIDAHGRFEGADLVTGSAVGSFRETRDIAWQNAVPFEEYASRR